MHFICSQTGSNDGGVCKPCFPNFSSNDSLAESSANLEGFKGDWIRNSDDDKIFRGTSPLKLLKEPPDMQSSLDGVPLDVLSSRRPLIIASSPKPPMRMVNKWVATPPARLPPLHPRSPPDAGATIPILPSTAKVAWPPSKPAVGVQNSPTEGAVYETPKPIPLSHPLSVPGSGFAPQYTPAFVAMDVITEGLAPLATSPLPEDQYELTEWDDSDQEKDACEQDKEAKRLLNKRVPAWCIGWIETAKTQTSIDPDTVFGTCNPKCDLEAIFNSGVSNAYMKSRRGKRGSSGEWGMDNVSRQELNEYRAVMGHTQQLDSVVIVQQCKTQKN